MDKYSDIIDLPHHQSKKRPHMPVYERAAQFAPFAALTGYDETIEGAESAFAATRENGGVTYTAEDYSI
ncbi:MAG: hypothetical protein Q4E57_07960 [Eubacteriales bacterium]|nr:hypothetical protein [Eubacteriales bacterium]